MRTFILEKLVHDGILKANEGIGAITDYIELEGDDRIEALVNKLEEELSELHMAASEEERAKEIEDIHSIIFAIREALGYEQMDPAYVPTKTFDKGYYIKTVSVPDGKWADYYASDPERFPEISNNSSDR